MKSANRSSRGTILIITLWVLTLLTTFALILSAGVRQKINVFSHLEDRSKLGFLAEAGIKKTIAIFNQDTELNRDTYSLEGKMTLHNNENQLRDIHLNGGTCEVSYVLADKKSEALAKRYGVVDEESKININKTNIITLKNIIKYALGWEEISASRLARAIMDWREVGESEIEGFSSDKYYENLEYPYEAKNADFELMDELLLVKGMNKEILKKLAPYITVYGSGKVNINTASAYVLVSLGLSENLVDKIIYMRQGKDGQEATEDDNVFHTKESILNDLRQAVKLEKDEVAEMEEFVAKKMLDVNAHFYLIESHARLDHGGAQATVQCVFNSDNHAFSFWKVEY